MCTCNFNIVLAFSIVRLQSELVSLMESAATLSAAAGVFAAVFAILQLLHIKQHRNLEMSIKLFEWAESHRLSKAFRWVKKKFQLED